MIKAVGFNISQEGKELIYRLVKNVLNYEDICIVFDAKYSKIELDKNDIVLFFGDRVKAMFVAPVKSVFLPDLNNLFNLKGNELYRYDTNKKLKEFALVLAQPEKPKEQIITAKEAEQLTEAEYICFLSDNKKVKITNDKEIDKSVDIQISIEELRDIKTAFEFLKGKEILIRRREKK